MACTIEQLRQPLVSLPQYLKQTCHRNLPHHHLEAAEAAAFSSTALSYLAGMLN
jgi:hypothetical protein